MRVATPSGWQMLSGTGDALKAGKMGGRVPGKQAAPRVGEKRLGSLLHMSSDRNNVQPRSVATLAT